MYDFFPLIREDMKPALGVTEPGAIAFLMALARAHIRGPVTDAELRLNSGMYKNAFSCGIPNSTHTGNLHAAALGLTAGKAEKGLEALSDITEEDDCRAEELIRAGRVRVLLDHMGSRIYLRALVRSGDEECEAVIQDTHTNVCYLRVNDRVLTDTRRGGENEADETPEIHRHTLAEMVEFIETSKAEDFTFLQAAYDMNLALLEEGLASERTSVRRYLLERNGGKTISRDERATAQVLCNAAIEARVLGLSRPAMSITGSGAHGIICTMPLYAVCKIEGLPPDRLYRATALSYLVTQYIKEYSGKLSAFCGCGIAAGTGAACAVAWLRGGDTETLERVIRNMAAGITGMICDGGNHGCAMKGVVAVDAAFSAAEMALMGVSIGAEHGICGDTPEKTMEYMGRIASPGMVKTEEEIVHIMEEK